MALKCETCPHWHKRGDDVPIQVEEVEGFGHCARAMVFWDATEWDEDREFRTVKPEFSDRRFFAQDGSDYRADVITRADFFCADHPEAPKP